MPIDLEGLDSTRVLIEHRGIRGGEAGTNKPIKTPPRVRHTIKTAKTNNKFPIDIPLMERIAERMGVGKDNWANKIPGIPVTLLSDDIDGENGVIFMHRALWAASGSLCSSDAGQSEAKQLVDIKKYAKNKDRTRLREPKTVECNSDCPMWGEAGEKTECKWSIIVSMQLTDDPMFPAPVRYRGTGKNTIRSVYTSLKYISDITGGILMGIPLVYVQSNKKTKDGGGQSHIIPVWHFEFYGTVQELRAAAAKELASRKALEEAHEGKFPDDALKFTSIDEESEDTNPEEANVAVEEVVVEDPILKTQSDVALLYKKLDFTKARRDLIEKKHEGDLEAVLAELISLSPKKPEEFNPSPGKEGMDEDDDDDLFSE